MATKKKSSDLEDQLTDEQRKERAESRQRLDQEVAQRKAREAAGLTVPMPSYDERAAERLAGDNILSLEDAIKPAIEKLEKLAKDSSEFCAGVREQLKEHVLDKCEFHEVPMDVDLERTYFESRMERKLTVVYSGCPDCRKASEESLGNERWAKMGVPGQLLHATLENFEIDTEPKARILEKVTLQLAKGKGFIILRGKYGTGKSHLAVGLLKKVGDGLFVTEGDLIGELRETYRNNSSQNILVDKYRHCRVLVIDELSLDVKGSDIHAFLYRILAYRYENGLLTIITSNETLQSILDIIGPRLADRIRPSYTVATMEWETHRKKEAA
jgi:DNA replication protein DnaC